MGLKKIKKIRQAKRVFYKYNKFLKGGIYELNSSAVCFTEINDIEKEGVYDFETTVASSNNLRTESRFSVEQSDGRFNCTKMLITNCGKTVKCFDFIANMVISVFECEEELRKCLEEIKDASAFFSSSKILEINQKELYVVEELLRDNATTEEEKWKCILEYYLKLSSNLNVQKQMKKFPLEHRYKNTRKIFEHYYQQHGINNLAIPETYQHGDLWTANVFCNNKECKVIDFSTLGYYMFFYDLALYMFTEAFIRKNESLLKQYLSGQYDFWIEKICFNFGMELNGLGREGLFVCAMEEMIFKRFNTSGGKKMVKSIMKFLNKMDICI